MEENKKSLYVTNWERERLEKIFDINIVAEYVINQDDPRVLQEIFPEKEMAPVIPIFKKIVKKDGKFSKNYDNYLLHYLLFSANYYGEITYEDAEAISEIMGKEYTRKTLIEIIENNQIDSEYFPKRIPDFFQFNFLSEVLLDVRDESDYEDFFEDLEDEMTSYGDIGVIFPMATIIIRSVKEVVSLYFEKTKKGDMKKVFSIIANSSYQYIQAFFAEEDQEDAVVVAPKKTKHDAVRDAMMTPKKKQESSQSDEENSTGDENKDVKQSINQKKTAESKEGNTETKEENVNSKGETTESREDNPRKIQMETVNSWDRDMNNCKSLNDFQDLKIKVEKSDIREQEKYMILRNIRKKVCERFSNEIYQGSRINSEDRSQKYGGAFGCFVCAGIGFLLIKFGPEWGWLQFIFTAGTWMFLILGIIVLLLAFVASAQWKNASYDQKINSQLLTDIKRSDLYHSDGDFYFPESDIKKMSRESVERVSKSYALYGLLEIFFRHGEKEERSDIQRAFEDRSWYKYRSQRYTEVEDLNEFEVYNYNLLNEVHDLGFKKI